MIPWCELEQPKRMLSLIVPDFSHGLFGTYTVLSNILKSPFVFLISPHKADIRVDFPLAIPPITQGHLTKQDFQRLVS